MHRFCSLWLIIIVDWTSVFVLHESMCSFFFLLSVNSALTNLPLEKDKKHRRFQGLHDNWTFLIQSGPVRLAVFLNNSLNSAITVLSLEKDKNQVLQQGAIR